MKTLKQFAFRHPQESMLLLFNLGFFAWIRVTMTQVFDQLGVTDAYQQYVPEWLRHLTGNSLAGLEQFLKTSSWAWLIAFLILIMIWRFLTRLVRTVFFLVILAGGLWLLLQNQHILNQLLG